MPSPTLPSIVHTNLGDPNAPSPSPVMPDPPIKEPKPKLNGLFEMDTP